jgi:hypothetical protein
MPPVKPSSKELDNDGNSDEEPGDLTARDCDQSKREYNRAEMKKNGKADN